jgi:hypothetical protein
MKETTGEHPPGNSSTSQIFPTAPEKPRVGYKNPPKHSRFQAGKSGNPKGRPKGSKNLETIVREEGAKKVTVNGPKGQRVVTITQAIVMQMAAKAARGDRSSQRDFLAMYARHEEAWSAKDEATLIQRNDHAVLETFAKRIRSYAANPSDKPEKEKSE